MRGFFAALGCALKGINGVKVWAKVLSIVGACVIFK